MFDVIAIGDLTFDIFNVISEANLRELPKEHISLLEVTYRDKIPVDQFEVGMGGNAANTAVGLSRLGLSVALYAARGDDSFGAYLSEKLKAEFIDDRYVVVERGGATNVSTILVYKRERTIFPYYVPRQYNAPKFANAGWIFISSGGKGFESVYDTVIEYQKRGVRVAYNPGPYQLRRKLSYVRKFIPYSNILFVNKEEGEMIVGGRGESHVDVARKLFALGAPLVIVTDDIRGACAVSAQGVRTIECFPSEVVEKTGAGDAFTTGFLASYIFKGDVDEALRSGSINAASVVTKIGAQAGLLKKKQLTAQLATHSSFKSKEED